MIIDVFHDTACPFCRIGKKNLQLALEQWEGEPVTVRFHPFFLNASIPPEGHEFRQYMIAKGGGQVPLEGFFDAPRRMGENVGLTFNFEAIQRAPNTELSHRLILLTPEGQREAVIDDVYAAYFEHGQDIGDLEVLVEIAARHGVDADTMREQLQGDAMREQVRTEAHTAAQGGITGVPFFILNNALAFSGAQPPEVMLRALKQAEGITPTVTVE
jgi:predicted DsbA family dithiol-disulfide isomerase